VYGSALMRPATPPWPRFFAAKGRPAGHPLIVHVASVIVTATP
jgi:tRNA A37 threonylcarbamoyladenosine synthetase subunit TsaC/SUA5/YrdC